MRDYHSVVRYRHLDGLRGVAALVVVCFHLVLAFDRALVSGAPGEAHFGWELPLSGAPFLLLKGSYPVMVFFALSGFVLAKSLSHTRLGMLALLVRRYIRFVIPIATICLISYGLLTTGAMRISELAAATHSTWYATIFQQSPSLKHALSEGFYRALVHPFPIERSYNSSLWTMPIEFYGSAFMIFIFGLTAWIFPSENKRQQLRLIVFSALAIIGYSSYLGLFSFGAALALIEVSVTIGNLAGGAILVLGIFFGTMPWSADQWAVIKPFTRLPIPLPLFVPLPVENIINFYGVVGACLTLVVANFWAPFRWLLSTRAAVFLGDISFPLYLVHIPLLTSLTGGFALTLLQEKLSYGVVTALSAIVELVASISIALVLLFICERPAIVLSRQTGQLVQTAKDRLKASAGHLRSKFVC